jgi:hypothetical protein
LTKKEKLGKIDQLRKEKKRLRKKRRVKHTISIVSLTENLKRYLIAWLNHLVFLEEEENILIWDASSNE